MIDLHRPEKPSEDSTRWWGKAKEAVGHLGEMSSNLHSIAQDLTNITIALWQMSGIANAVMHEDGTITVTRVEDDGEGEYRPPKPLTEEQRTVYQHGSTKVHSASGGPLAWVLTPPPPYNASVIVCSPDEALPLGMRCYAEQRLPGGERDRWTITFSQE